MRILRGKEGVFDYKTSIPTTILPVVLPIVISFPALSFQFNGKHHIKGPGVERKWNTVCFIGVKTFGKAVGLQKRHTGKSGSLCENFLRVFQTFFHTVK